VFVGSCLAILAGPTGAWAGPSEGSVIDEAFRPFLLQDEAFLREGGAGLIQDPEGRLALLGVGKVVPENPSDETMPATIRIGEIRARKAILELGQDASVSVARGLAESEYSETASGRRISLSSFFHTTETKVEGQILRMPVVGTWWSSDRAVFYVAVGKLMASPGEVTGSPEKVVPEDPFEGIELLESTEPFLALLKADANLRRNGGVRGFLLGDGRRVLMAVSSASVGSSIARSRKIARLRALRMLLEDRNGISFSSTETIADSEQMILTEEGVRTIVLSEFLSVQEEAVSGVIQALPIVAAWQDPEGRTLSVALGQVFVQEEN
jgi:hypothetical protein